VSVMIQGRTWVRSALGIIGALSAVAALPSGAQAQRVPPSATRSATPPASHGRLEVRNTLADSVRLEVRIGPSENCNANAHAATRVIRPGRTWAVASDQVVCWRRETGAADPTGPWSRWQSRRVPPGQTAKEAP